MYYTVHGWGLNPKTTGKLYGAMSLLERAACRLSTEVVFVSNSDREIGIRNHWASRAASRLVYNGIADHPAGRARLRESLNIPGEIPVILFVARLSEPKDPAFAIRVSACLADYGLEHRLLIIGDGPMHEACSCLIKELRLDERVWMLGYRNDVRELLADADIFCLFTKREGLPISVMEAMFAGLPVVASSVGGIPEIVENGKTGFLLDEFDIEKAAGLLAKLIKNIDVRKTMGEAGRAVALSRFTLGSMVEGYRRLYET